MLAAAVTLSVAGAANAAIDTFASGDGELFLSIRDNTHAQSIVLDLNTNLSAFMPGSAAASSAFSVANVDVQSFVAAAGGASADLSWAVMAGDQQGSDTAGGLNYLTTSLNASIIPQQNQTIVDFGGVDAYLVNNNSLLGTSDTLVSASGDASYFNSTMDTWTGVANFSATAGVNQSMNFFAISNSGSTGGFFTKTQLANVNQYTVAGTPATWTLDDTGVLHYSAVPVPPAVWLLGSALMGLVGVARRKSQNV